jgi:hypothetical protein
VSVSEAVQGCRRCARNGTSSGRTDRSSEGRLMLSGSACSGR